MKRNVLVWVEVAIIASLSMAMSFIPKVAGWFLHRRKLFLLPPRRRLDTRFSSRFAMGITPLCSRCHSLSVEQVPPNMSLHLQ